MEGLSPIRFVGPSFTTTSLGPNDPKVGDILERGVSGVGYEKYIFVYNGGASQINPGYGATLSGVSGLTVTVSSTISVDLCVGVCKHATIAASGYGYLMVRGFSQAVTSTSVSITAGGMVGLGADGSFEHKSIATGLVGNIVGKAMQTIGSASSGTIYVSLW